MILSARLSAGLAPGRWSELFRTVLPLELNDYHMVNFRVVGQGDMEEAASILLQDSADGISWSHDETWPDQLAPGGVLDISAVFHRAYVRAMITSTGSGSVAVEVTPYREQANTSYIQEPLTCAVGCEVECETGSETGA